MVDDNVVIFPRSAWRSNPASSRAIDLNPLHPVPRTGPTWQGKGEVVRAGAVEKHTSLCDCRTTVKELGGLGNVVGENRTANLDGGGEEAEKSVGSDGANREEEDCGR
jgi:hypothetical protein